MKHGVADDSLELDSRLQVAVHFRQEEPDAIATVRFGLVKRQIGAFQKALRGGTIRWRDRNPDGRRDHDLMLVEPYRDGQSGPEPMGECLDLIMIEHTRLNHDEFVTTQARDQVVRPGRRPQALADRREQVITGVMTEAIVDLLETIQIDEMHREGAA